MIVGARKIYISIFCLLLLPNIGKRHLQPENLQLIDLRFATTIFCNIADQLTGTGDAGLMLHDIVLPTIVTMFTVILSIAACILLLIIKRQWETYPEFDQQQQVREITAKMPLKRPLSVKRNFKSKDIDCLK